MCQLRKMRDQLRKPELIKKAVTAAAFIWLLGTRGVGATKIALFRNYCSKLAIVLGV